MRKVVSATKRSHRYKPVRSLLTKTNPTPSKKPIFIFDENGEVIPFDRTILVDEFNDIGIDYAKEEYRKYGYNLTVVETIGPFAAGTDKQRLLKVEPKAKKDKNIETTIEGFKGTYETSDTFFIDKANPPENWDKYPNDRGRVSIGYLHDILDEILPLKGNVLVIVDSHNSYGKGISNMLDTLSIEDERTVVGNDYNSRAGPYSHPLQTEDYFAYSSLQDVRGEELGKTLVDKLKIRIREWQNKINPWEGLK